MKTFLPLLLLVLIHHFLLAPLIRKKLPLYIGLLTVLLVLYGVWCLNPAGRTDVPPRPEMHPGMLPPPPPGPDGKHPGPEGGQRPMRPEVMKLIMGVLLIGAFINSGFRYVTANILSAMGKIRSNLVISSIGIILQVAFDILLIPRFGAIGVAYSNCVVFTIMSIALFGVFYKIYFKRK